MPTFLLIKLDWTNQSIVFYHFLFIFIRTVLKRLPDKGQKFIETNNKIDERLQEFKVESDGLSEMLSGMTLSACPNVNQMEWIGKVVSDNSSPQSSPSNQQKAIPNDESRDIVDILLTTNQMSKIVIDER